MGCSCFSRLSIVLNLLCCMISSASNHLYIGCYLRFTGSSSNKTTNSVSQCLTECRSQMTLFAAIKEGSSCYCGNIKNTRVPSSNCNLPCGDNNGACGGNNFYAVYADIPAYQGCFSYRYRFQHMDLSHFYIEVSIDRCYAKCLSLNYRYCGVQIVKQIRRQIVHCFCGDKYSSYERYPDSECELCFENENIKCGSDSKISIYSVGHLPSLNKSYSEVFHCLGGVTDKNGTCNSTKCKNGWKGAKCNQRDCERYNGECDEHKCEDIKIGNQNISECVCNEGFQSISVYDECTDTDECQSNPCNEPSETCINTFGSFMCTCSPGYNYTYQSDCGAYCSESLYSCKNSTSCNRLSNYICSLEIKDIHGGRTTIILGVFLALCLCAIIIYLVGMLFCRKKLKDTESRQEKRKTIHDERENSGTHYLSNQYHEENNYDELRINEIYEN